MLENETRDAGCYSPDPAGSNATFWGVLLLVAGSLFLLENLGVISPLGDVLLPTFIIAWGIHLVWQAVRSLSLGDRW